MIRCPSGHCFNGPIEFLAFEEPARAAGQNQAQPQPAAAPGKGRHDAAGPGGPSMPERSLTKICNYLRRHQARMHYDEYLAAGYPIASGVIEGACRHVVRTGWSGRACTGRFPVLKPYSGYAV